MIGNDYIIPLGMLVVCFNVETYLISYFWYCEVPNALITGWNYFLAYFDIFRFTAAWGCLFFPLLFFLGGGSVVIGTSSVHLLLCFLMEVFPLLCIFLCTLSGIIYYMRGYIKKNLQSSHLWSSKLVSYYASNQWMTEYCILCHLWGTQCLV